MYNEKVMDFIGEWYEQDLPILTDGILSDGHHYSIWISPSIKYPNMTFKIYYGNFTYNNINISYLKESKMCRIRIDKPEYGGLPDEDLILTRELRDKFIEAINNWDEILEYMNDSQLNLDTHKNFSNCSKPDYSKLAAD